MFENCQAQNCWAISERNFLSISFADTLPPFLPCELFDLEQELELVLLSDHVYEKKFESTAELPNLYFLCLLEAHIPKMVCNKHVCLEHGVAALGLTFVAIQNCVEKELCLDEILLGKACLH
jgi:hypothetical protein